jgi:hypothetical protein
LLFDYLNAHARNKRRNSQKHHHKKGQAMRITLSLIVLVICLIFSGSAFALTIDDVKVGDAGAPDILMERYSAKPSNMETEQALFSDALGVDVYDRDLRVYDFEDNYDGWDYLGEDLWAFDFGPDFRPEYFLIKTGKIRFQGDNYNYFFFENVGSLRYGVIDLTEFGDEKITLATIGHLTIPNPEPSTLLLLGAGIVGLAFYRRKSR